MTRRSHHRAAVSLRTERRRTIARLERELEIESGIAEPDPFPMPGYAERPDEFWGFWERQRLEIFYDQIIKGVPLHLRTKR